MDLATVSARIEVADHAVATAAQAVAGAHAATADPVDGGADRYDAARFPRINYLTRA